MEIAFAEIAFLVTFSSLVGIFAIKLKQPPLLGYIAAGVIIGALNIMHSDVSESIELFSQIGVAFLLFLLGLELDFNEVKYMGKNILLLGFGQIIFTMLLSSIVSVLLGFSFISSFYLGIALTFSSTIVIVKLFTSKKELDTLHGKLAIGLLLIQDFVAIFAMITLIAFGSPGADTHLFLQIVIVFAKLGLLLGILMIFSKIILPWIIEQTGHEREILFISMIGWALFFATLAASPWFDFSIEIGALLAGIALSSRTESLQIESWSRPLRDFFLTIFFVMLGLHIDLSKLDIIIIPTIGLCIIIVVIKPLIMMIILGLLGYNKRTNFFTSISISQISEFSLLIIGLGASLGHLSDDESAAITLVGGLTMGISSYLIVYKHKLYNICKGWLHVFELNKNGQKHRAKRKMKDFILIFGFHRLGEDMFQTIKDNPKNFIIVDYNPVTVDRLHNEGINAYYGDMLDTDLYEKVGIENAKLIISTIPDKSATYTLIEFMKSQHPNIPVIVTAGEDKDAKEFYNREVEYVLYPHLLAGQKLKNIIDTDKEFGEKLANLSKRQIPAIDRRLGLSINENYSS